MRFKIKKAGGGDQPWYFRIEAGNGRVLATSERYRDWNEAWSAADQVKKQASLAPIE